MKVKKRKGGIEDWNKEKLVRSMMNAGLHADESRCVATLIETHVFNQIPEPINSASIRKMVIKILKALESPVVNIYRNFSK